MDEHLQRLVQELRAGKCPPRVLEKVGERIAEKRRKVDRYWLRPIGFAVGLAVLLASVVVWRWPSRDSQVLSQAALSNRADQVRVAQEAGAALAYIGAVLLEAGQHTETILWDQAVPPLRSGFETATETIRKQM